MAALEAGGERPDQARRGRFGQRGRHEREWLSRGAAISAKFNLAILHLTLKFVLKLGHWHRVHLRTGTWRAAQRKCGEATRARVRHALPL